LEAWLKAHKDDAEARDLLAESYYRPALAAIQAQQWEQASEFLQNLHQISPQYRDTAEWSWRYPSLAWLSGNIKELASIKPENGGSMVFSPDGRLIALVSRETVKIYEAFTGRLLRALIEHTSYVSDIAFSPDGRLLVSASDDLTVKIWEVASGHLLYDLRGYKTPVRSVVFSPDSRFLALGSEDGTVTILEIASRRKVRTLTGHKKRVEDVAFSPDGRFLVSKAPDGMIVWDVASGSRANLPPDKALAIYATIYGRLKADIRDEGRRIVISDTISGRLLNTIDRSSRFSYEGDSQVYGVAFSPDNRLLALGKKQRGYGGADLEIWEVATGRLLYTLGWHSKDIWGVFFSPDGRLLASRSYDNVKIWGPA
jgi:WD40 repeat protein